MDAATIGGLVREHEPCSKCGRPRQTLMVAASDMPTYINTNDKAPRPDHVFTTPITVTICMSCDGGVEFAS